MKNLLVGALIALVACGSDTTGPRSVDAAGDAPSSRLETDYRYEPYPGSQWYGPDGHEVPMESNVINAITGPDHCDWEGAVIMHVGWPPGHDAADASESRQYLRDPERIFPRGSLMTRFDPDVELPERAEYTGYRTDFMELWLDKKNDKAAYVVFADHVELWPRAGEIIACA